jgi:hypothetical protein
MKRRLLYLIGGILLSFAHYAWAQSRQIPVEVQRGWLRHVQETVITIDDRQLQLAPGATIRNQQNMIVVPVSLPPEGALAEYQLDASGQVARAWLLTPDEAAREPPPR